MSRRLLSPSDVRKMLLDVDLDSIPKPFTSVAADFLGDSPPLPPTIRRFIKGDDSNAGRSHIIIAILAHGIPVPFLPTDDPRVTQNTVVFSLAGPGTLACMHPDYFSDRVLKLKTMLQFHNYPVNAVLNDARQEHTRADARNLSMFGEPLFYKNKYPAADTIFPANRADRHESVAQNRFAYKHLVSENMLYNSSLEEASSARNPTITMQSFRVNLLDVRHPVNKNQRDLAFQANADLAELLSQNGVIRDTTTADGKHMYIFTLTDLLRFFKDVYGFDYVTIYEVACRHTDINVDEMKAQYEKDRADFKAWANEVGYNTFGGRARGMPRRRPTRRPTRRVRRTQRYRR